MTTKMTDADQVARLDELVSHMWMVRTFLKHCDEAEEDDELCEVFRELYDFMMAVGGPVRQEDDAAILKLARKKLRRLKSATDLFLEIQPEISSHTNFQMAALSLKTAVAATESLLNCPGD